MTIWYLTDRLTHFFIFFFCRLSLIFQEPSLEKGGEELWEEEESPNEDITSEDLIILFSKT